MVDADEPHCLCLCRCDSYVIAVAELLIGRVGAGRCQKRHQRHEVGFSGLYGLLACCLLGAVCAAYDAIVTALQRQRQIRGDVYVDSCSVDCYGYGSVVAYNYAGGYPAAIMP